MNIEVNTVFRKIVIDSLIKPESPIFKILNTGAVEAYINNNMVLFPDNFFGIDNQAVVAALLHKGYEVKNNTSYQISFNPVGAPKEVTLIETFVKIIK